MAGKSDQKSLAEVAEAFSLSDLSKIREHIKESGRARLEHRRLFFAAIGQGITAWSGMEETLVRIAAKLLRTSEVKAGLVMYSIMNFHVWL